MDTEENSKEGKLEGGRIWVRLTWVEKIMVLVWGHSEMVVNSCLEDLKGRMGLKKMGKLLMFLCSLGQFSQTSP